MTKNKPDDFSVVIPTNRTINDISPLLGCICKQTKKPKELIIVYDRDVSKQKFDKYLKQIKKILDNINIELIVVSNHTFPNFQAKKWASFVRNFWISLVQTKLLCCIDDDNEFGEDFFEEMIKMLWYSLSSREMKRSIQEKHRLLCRWKNSSQWQCNIIIPTEIYHKTWKIRSRWYIWFNYRIGRQVGTKYFSSEKSNLSPISFSSANCLFWRKKVFKTIPFNEELPFVYEDFLMTRQVSKSVEFDLYCAKNIFINHIMRDKTKIQDLYIHTKFHAYQKSRNRIIFVKKTANWSQKVIYFGCGLWVHTIYLILMVLLKDEKDEKKEVKGSKKYEIVKAILKGIWDGFLF